MRRSRRYLSSTLTALFVLSMGSVAFGQEADEGVIYKKKTVFSFEDDTIDGDLTRPDHGFIESRKKLRHSNLIKIRDNFREKILESYVNI